jgi:hypothetical protein
MRIGWKSRRTQIVAGAVLLVLLVLSISQGAFTTWGQWDYIGWWVLLPVAVLLPVTLALLLIRLLSRRD